MSLETRDRRAIDRGGRVPGALVILAMSLGGAATAAPKVTPRAFDASKVKDRLVVVHDGKGHHVAYLPFHGSLNESRMNLFYGDGKVFYRQRCTGGSRNGSDLYISISDPRFLLGASSMLRVRGGKAEMRCGKRWISLSELGASRTRAMIKKARFLNTYWQRTPHALARDDDGIYYYVDRLLRDTSHTRSHRGFRVFVGPRGRMKPLRMKNIVSDHVGEIFITTKGKLRLLIDRGQPAKGKATWIVGNKRSGLTWLDVKHIRTVSLIHSELGVYMGQKFHTPCDDL